MTKVIRRLVEESVISEQEGEKLDNMLMTDAQVLAEVVVMLCKKLDGAGERLEKLEGVVQP